jgi:hypothetical protein
MGRNERCWRHKTEEKKAKGAPPTAGSPVALSSGGGFLPLDRACRELQAQVKAAAWSWLAIDHSRWLREFPYQRSKQRFFAGLPLPPGHNPSAMGADVTRKRSFGDTRFLRCCQVYRHNQGDALLNSPVEKHSTKIRRWSRVVHRSLSSAQRKGPFLREFCFLLVLVLLCHRKGEYASSESLYFCSGNQLSIVDVSKKDLRPLSSNSGGSTLEGRQQAHFWRSTQSRLRPLS